MKCYLCKFIPPRPDFLETMTPDEKKLMDGHVAFLDELLTRRTIVAHGPVLDEAGPYGVALYRIDDDQTIEAITAGDPIIAGGCGHYEHHPMLHLTALD